MSIEQKIAELLAESKKLQAEEVVSEETIEEETEIVSEEEIKPTKGEEEPNNKKNNVDKNPQGEKKATVKEDITVDVSEDVAALTNGEELSEEFKTKAATIFEAAVVTRVKAEVAKLEEQFELQLNEQVEEIKEGLIEKVDGYLDYVVEQWMEQNELALESGIKAEIVENFITRLKDVFVESYIDIPEEKYDVVGEMEETIESLESKLNESVEAAVALKRELDDIKRVQSISEATAGLADTDAEKFKALAEELSFEDVDTFSTKLQTIRENYFGKKATASNVSSVVTDEPVQLTEENVYSPQMSAYIKALKK